LLLSDIESVIKGIKDIRRIFRERGL
jgi:hypothetical protein